MTAASAESTLPVWQRLWIYQRERFPLGKTAALLAVFSSAGINVSAYLADRPMPGLPFYVVAFIVCLIFFFQLRACDEVKDAEDDSRFRPERPIPRQLVSLRLIVGIAIACIPVALVATVLVNLWLAAFVLLVWLWMGLMTAEFFVPQWLKARPFLYLTSHMMIMPLIDLFVTACEWVATAGTPPAAVGAFLLLSFANGCVLEIGRKIYAPANERVGVETYSAILGAHKAVLLWFAALVCALACLIATGLTVGAPRTIGIVGLAAFLMCGAAGILFLKSKSTDAQVRIDGASGLWVLICYGAAGLIPLALRL